MEIYSPHSVVHDLFLALEKTALIPQEEFFLLWCEFWMNVEKHLFVVYLEESHAKKKHVNLTRIWGILETDGIQFISFKIGALYKLPV